MIDFSLPTELDARATSIRRFLIDEVISHERHPRLTRHRPTRDVRQELVEKARANGLLLAQRPATCCGNGLSHTKAAAVPEASGWSAPGPLAMNCCASVGGNMLILSKICRPDQAETCRGPMAQGRQRSVLARKQG